MSESIAETVTKYYPLTVTGGGWSVSFRSQPTVGIETTGRLPTKQEVIDAFTGAFSQLPVVMPLLVHSAMVELHRRAKKPLQEDGESLDVTCKDFDLLERKHKQEPWVLDQQDHYEAGWEAAVQYYFGKLS